MISSKSVVCFNRVAAGVVRKSYRKYLNFGNTFFAILHWPWAGFLSFLPKDRRNKQTATANNNESFTHPGWAWRHPEGRLLAPDYSLKEKHPILGSLFQKWLMNCARLCLLSHSIFPPLITASLLTILLIYGETWAVRPLSKGLLGISELSEPKSLVWLRV